MSKPVEGENVNQDKQESVEYYHHPLCSSSHRFPNGTKGHSCSCKVIHNSEWRELEAKANALREESDRLKRVNQELQKELDKSGNGRGAWHVAHSCVPKEQYWALEKELSATKAQLEVCRGALREANCLLCGSITRTSKPQHVVVDMIQSALKSITTQPQEKLNSLRRLVDEVELAIEIFFKERIKRDRLSEALAEVKKEFGL